MVLVTERDAMDEKALKTEKIPEIERFPGFFGASSGIRTPDTLLKRQVLCRLS